MNICITFWITQENTSDMPPLSGRALNHKDVGMHSNEGPNVWSSNLMHYQPIFLQNNCVCSDP